MFLGTIQECDFFLLTPGNYKHIVFEPTHTATSYYTTPQYCIMYRECCHILPDWAVIFFLSACKWNTAWYCIHELSCKSHTPLCKSKTNQPPPEKYPVWNPGVYKTIKTNAYVNQINQIKKHCVYMCECMCVCVCTKRNTITCTKVA